MIRHVFQGDLELTMFTVMNICNEWLRSKDIGVCFRHTHSDDEVAILLWDIQDAERRLRQLTERIYHYSSVHITMAIGTISTHMHEAYQEALAIHLGRDLTGKEPVVSRTERKSELPHLFDYATELKLLIQAGDKDKLSSKVMTIVDSLYRKQGLTLARLKEWDDQFNLLQSNWLKEYGITLEKKPEGWDYWGRDGSFLIDRFKEGKRKDFLELIDCLSNIRYQKEKNPMQEVEQFLKKHYVEEVSLQEIADRFFLSREYISRRFKQEYGVTITDYLASVRVEKAKQLLSNPYVKIYQVAHDVGFQNEKYFSKVFKKLTGETPAQFRQSLAQ
ncbi:helix-turn-helix transcriptional regulator [Rossellomorea marisflavi]|nr:helix-turn-helix transcriptional regulator [Rossellomorea marisflavi]MCM2606969.1 helix-turn-helix transcriptional regulator [Rossellomorea marisflavi]